MLNAGVRFLSFGENRELQIKSSNQHSAISNPKCEIHAVSGL